MSNAMEKAAERKLAQASGETVQEERRFRQGAQSFGHVCFGCYYDPPWAGLIREKEAEVIAAALFDRAGCEPAGQGGRGELLRYPFEGGTALLRPYRRGGLIRHFLKDAYLLDNRPRRELRVQAILYGNGFPVPEPLGAVWQRSRVLYRGAITWREVPGKDLLGYLAASPKDAEAVFEQAGALVRRMHDLGVYHADLQVRNVLVGKHGLYLLDFDNARKHDELSQRLRARNILRFKRSTQKHRLHEELFAAFLRGYGEVIVPKWLRCLYALKGTLSDVICGREA